MATEDKELPRIVSHLSNYDPPFDLVGMTHRMLRQVPRDYLNGLDVVVLINTEALSRKRLRSSTKSRKRKIRIAQTRGLYHPAWKGSTAWIEIFVDRTYERWAKGIWLRIPIIREMALSDVLFHEIGHHIHATARPEFREREDVAEEWRRKLEARYYLRQYWWLKPLAYILRPAVRLLSKLYPGNVRGSRLRGA